MADVLSPAPSILDTLRRAAPDFLSRKLLAFVLTKVGALLITLLALTKLPPELAVRLVEVLVPTMAGLCATYLAAQGWIDKHEVTAEALSADVRAGLAAAQKQPGAAEVVVASGPAK